MKSLKDCEYEIHSCSKCGICQAVCPVYKITGNDCTVSRGHFIMLRGLLKGDLKMSKTINKYLDMCLKCNACTKFCPSGIDIADIIALAKAEYFKSHLIEKIISVLYKTFIIEIYLNCIKFLFSPFRKYKSKKFTKKVMLFSGCYGKLNGETEAVKILNSMGIEVITANFGCCGMPYFIRGDFDNFNKCMKDFYSKTEKWCINDVVTTCASCEKTLKSYVKWGGNENIKVKNIYEYIKENNLHPKLKRNFKVTFHKPCNLSNYDDVKWLLNNTENLEYVEMNNYDSCCGFNGVFKISNHKIISKILKNKSDNIKATKAKIVLTSCLGCETALRLKSFGKYKVKDLIKFYAQNI